MKKILILVCAILFSIPTFAQNDKGGSGAHGGDSAVFEFIKIAKKICYWANEKPNDLKINLSECSNYINELFLSLNYDKPKLSFENNIKKFESICGQKQACYIVKSDSILVSRTSWISLEIKDKVSLVATEFAAKFNPLKRYDLGYLAFVESDEIMTLSDLKNVNSDINLFILANEKSEIVDLDSNDIYYFNSSVIKLKSRLNRTLRNLDFKIKLDVTYAKSICNNELSREVIKNTYFQLNSNQPKNIDQKFNAKSYLKDWVISNNNGNGSCTIHVNFKLTYNSLLSKIDYSKFTLVVNNKEQMGSELFAFIW